MQTLAKHLKTSTTPIVIEDRKEFLDALCDQIVTATGSGAFLGMNMEGALSEVDQSNWSKFDENGNPIFDENGKISKSPAYRKPELEPFI
jgi:predicted HAD superfamily Cof-like phosphohydrolase